MTTEQLAALKEVAEQVKGPFQSALHEVAWREEFRERFNPTTCLALLEEVERLTKDHQSVRESVDKLVNSDFVCSRCGSQKK